jgi:translation initiation factor 6
LGVILFSLFGNASIGVHSLVTDKMAIVPPQVSEFKAKRLANWLKVRVVRVTIGESTLIGALACANSKGIVLPHFVQEKEIKAIKLAFDINTVIMKTKKTAYGNLVLANDYGAIVDPKLKKKDVTKIADVLDTDTVPCEIADLPYVGSLAFATNKGALVHPMVKDEEKKVLASVLKVQVDVGTVNRGIPYVSTGLIGNVHGVAAGSLTTGPELFAIENMFRGEEQK